MKTLTNAQKLEQRRLRAVALIRQGIPQVEAARQLGVWPETVNRWYQRCRRGGTKALKSRQRGVRSRLSFSQKQQLLKELVKGAQAHGYPSALWTQERIAGVCKKKFGVSYHFNHIGKLLKALGWSWQKPATRAIERSEREVKRWLREDWPLIKKKPEGSAKALYS